MWVMKVNRHKADGICHYNKKLIRLMNRWMEESMGISSYIIFVSDEKNVGSNLILKNKCILLYVAQLIFNFFWSIIFFKFKLYYVAFAWLIVLWILVFLLIGESKKINKVSSYLLMPYLFWMTFAAYLNIGVTILN